MSDVGGKQAVKRTPPFLLRTDVSTGDLDFQNPYIYGGVLLVDAAANLEEQEESDVRSHTATDVLMAPTWTAGSLTVESIVNRVIAVSDTGSLTSSGFFAKKLIQDASRIPGLVEVFSGPLLDEVRGGPHDVAPPEQSVAAAGHHLAVALAPRQSRRGPSDPLPDVLLRQPQHARGGTDVAGSP